MDYQDDENLKINIQKDRSYKTLYSFVARVLVVYLDTTLKDLFSSVIYSNNTLLSDIDSLRKLCRSYRLFFFVFYNSSIFQR